MEVAKFRPLLSINDVEFLLAAIEAMPSSVQAAATHKKLATFALKVRHGINSPSYYGSGEAAAVNQLAQIGGSEEEIAAYLEAEMNKRLPPPLEKQL